MQDLNINPESLLSISGNVWVYWKDINGIYLGCNTTMAEALQLSSPQELIGKTDYELALITREEADAFRASDQAVITSGTTLQFQDFATLPDKKLRFLVIKSPLIDANKNRVGVIGLSYCQEEIEAISLHTHEHVKNLSEASLTPREKETLRLLIRGKTAKETAKILKLSHRTIEHYLENIRSKTNTYSKSELIEKTIDYFS